ALAERARRLRAVGTELLGIEDAVPARVALGRRPALIADRWRRVRDAEELARGRGLDAADQALGGDRDRVAAGEQARVDVIRSSLGGRIVQRCLGIVEA